MAGDAHTMVSWVPKTCRIVCSDMSEEYAASVYRVTESRSQCMNKEDSFFGGNCTNVVRFEVLMPTLLKSKALWDVKMFQLLCID